jgi:annexin A7/11
MASSNSITPGFSSDIYYQANNHQQFGFSQLDSQYNHNLQTNKGFNYLNYDPYSRNALYPPSVESTPCFTNHVNQHTYQGTVKPNPFFNPNEDCQELKKNVTKLMIHKRPLLNILCYRSNDQRQQIRDTFKKMYGQDLLTKLSRLFGGSFEDLMILLMYTPSEFDAYELNNAMVGFGTTESTLIEILTTRNNREINNIKMSYRLMFGKELESVLISETSGHFKNLLVSLCNGRNENFAINPIMAKKSAQDLYTAGVKRWGTDESTFNAIFCTQSYPQLRLVFEEYQKLAGHDIEYAIQKEFSGDIKNGLMAIVKTVRNTPAFFAERLNDSQVNDKVFSRIIVSRCEKDLVYIKHEFENMYKITLENFISQKTTGDFKDALLALVKHQ